MTGGRGVAAIDCGECGPTVRMGSGYYAGDTPVARREEARCSGTGAA